MDTDNQLNNDWRKVASVMYHKPVDSKIFGEVELDVTYLEEYISAQRKKGVKITLTHVFAVIVARCLKNKVPALNAYVRRGRVVPRKSIEAMVSVLKGDGSLGSVKIPNADTMNVEEIADFLNNEIRKARKGKETGVSDSKNILATMPWPFRNWFFNLYKRFVVDWGFSFPWLGLTPSSFGSFVISNIGSLGLETGYPALMPGANVAFVLVLGGVKKKPVVVNDEVVIRRMMSLSIVLDHRVVDASHGGQLFRCIKQFVEHPEKLDV
ncbi:MAG: 2-oxo acid dehydrogenase subunit E2 [Prolixibacteraceae bacterium]|nr:2-oxo acid dehydrogenase subunit E2 [Prolixibacteraceae bacterium]